MSGYKGAIAPKVAGFSAHGYPMPANWSNPYVTGHGLMVHRDQLRNVASSLSKMAGQLQSKLNDWQGAVATAPGAGGVWLEAGELNNAIRRSNDGISQYVSDLVQAHSDTAVRLNGSADNYDQAEQANIHAASLANDPSATQIQAGGDNLPVDPWYGKTAPSLQAQDLYYRLRNMPGNNGEVWNGTFNITENAPFQMTSTAGLKAGQIRAMLAQTDPGTITGAGAAYKTLVDHLTTMTGQLATHGQTLADNWGGTTAVIAVSQVQQLHQTTTDLQANAWQAQQALSWYGPVLAAYQSSVPTAATASQASQNQADQAAQQHLAELNTHIETAYNQMPPVVNKNLPPPLSKTPQTTTPGGTGTGGAGGGAPLGGLPGGGVPGGAVPVGAPGGTGPGSVTPGVPLGRVSTPGTTTHLQSVSPGPVVQPGGPGVGVPGGGLPGSGGPGPGLPGGGAPGSGLPGGGFPLAGPGGPGGGGLGDPAAGDPALGDPAVGDPALAAAPGGLGDPADAALPDGAMLPDGTLSAAGDAAGPGGMAGFPMMGGGGGGAGGADRMRESWEPEGEGTWAGDEGGLPGNGMVGAEALGYPMPGDPGMGGGPGDPMGGGADWAAGTPLPGADSGMVPPAGAPRGKQQASRARQWWMNEDADIWGGADDGVPPVIG
jgi:Zn-finger nucleic acid-binding protein